MIGKYLLSGAISHLGEPITQLGFRLGDKTNFVNTEEAQFKVNVKGPNDKGNFWLKLAQFHSYMNKTNSHNFNEYRKNAHVGCSERR